MQTDKHTATRPTPYQLGYTDGFESPDELSMGMTWPDNQDANEEYDRGVNAGQAARKELNDNAPALLDAALGIIEAYRTHESTTVEQADAYDVLLRAIKQAEGAK